MQKKTPNEGKFIMKTNINTYYTQIFKQLMIDY